MINGVAGHLRTHLHHLLQTHKLCLILWKNRLSNSVALLGKASSIAIVSVDFNIMQALILRLRCARLKDLTGLWFHNFLRSIQSWRFLDYWRIFANSLRVELHSMFWHSIILDKISLWPRLWRFLDKCCHSTEHLFKHTKPSTTWINRYVHPGVS